jgi:hypothetical protein
MATGANPAQIHFAHAAVAHIDPETDKLHWIVTPNTVARDEDEADVVTSDAQSAELTEGARQLEAVLMEGFDSVEQWLRYNESLRHPKHAAALDPLRAKAAGILKRRWDKQGARLIKASGKWLRTMAGQLKEAYTPAERRHMQQTVTAHVNATGVLDADPDERDIARFDAVVTGGMEAGIARMEADHAIALAKDKGERAIAQYLKEKGFVKLAKDIDATSKERIVNALVDAFDGGGTYKDAVSAIRGAYGDMKETRADMIARTELNGAYNDAMLTSAREVDGAMKTWDPDGEACEEICTPNVDQGAIPVDDDFESGDDAPPGHPHCDCSLGFDFPSGVEESRSEAAITA